MRNSSYSTLFCIASRSTHPISSAIVHVLLLQIADFGFAASGREGMMCDSIVGSKTYMAPEVLNRGTNMQYDHHGYDGAKVGPSTPEIVFI